MKATLFVFCVGLLVGVSPAADSLNVRRIGGCDTPDQACGVAVSGDYAYVADFGSGLRVISISDPAHPTEVGYCGTPGWARAVTVVGDYAYVAADTAGLRVISVVDPANPTEVGRCVTPGRAYGVAVAGGYAYVAADTAGLRVISVADPGNPTEVGHCDTMFAANGVAVSGSYAYVTDRGHGMWVVSVADPAHPEVVCGFYMMSSSGLGVAVKGDYAYLTSTVTTAFPGLTVVSVADPSHPILVGRCGTVSRAWGVALGGENAYVAADEAGLRVISVVDPAMPDSVGHYDMPGWANGVAASGDYAYVAYGREGLQIFQYYQALGDIDVDNDSLDVVADTVGLWYPASGASMTGNDHALGAFVLANTSESYNPDTADGPSLSSLDSLSFTGSLAGPGGTLDSIRILNLPESLVQGQSVVCTLAVYVPDSMPVGDYAGPIVITGIDSVRFEVAETVYALVRKGAGPAELGDIDVDNDSLDVAADTIRILPRLVSPGPPPKATEFALGEFILANTSESYNPDTADGPSLTYVDSLGFTGSLAGPGGTLDSIIIPDLPGTLAQGQAVECTLAVYMPPLLPDGDYVGSITITGKDSAGMLVGETFHARIGKQTLGDLDVDGDSLDVDGDTMDLRTQSAGPVYSPYAKARFMLLNTYEFYNPDIADGPSRSPLFITGWNAELLSSQDATDSIYLLNLPSYLDLGQAVECTLALVLPVGTSPDAYTGLVTIDGCDTLGYAVRDSFFFVVRGPQPRQNLDSLRVAPVPFKPHQNPEHDAIHFQGLSAGARVTVYDASGQTVWSETEKGDGHLAWDAKVASGIYVYLVVSADGKSRVGKLSVIR